MNHWIEGLPRPLQAAILLGLMIGLTVLLPAAVECWGA